MGVVTHKEDVCHTLVLGCLGTKHNGQEDSQATGNEQDEEGNDVQA